MMLELYIATNGHDAWSGRLPDANREGTDGPFATLERARDEIRAVRPTDGAVVRLRGGCYFRETTFTLTAEDSGTAEAPIVYRAAPGEDVRLIGGREITGFTRPDDATLRRLPESARAHAVQVSLPALGITDYGRYLPRGHGGGQNHAALELFVNNRVQTPARWPNASPLPNHGFELIDDVRGESLVYPGDRPRNWASYDDIYLHGYFSLDWASTIVKVVSLNPDTREMTLDPPAAGHYGLRINGRYFYFNVLEELDTPGEWHLDRASGLLTLWPSESIDDAEVIVSLLDAPQIACTDVSHVTFERLQIGMGRGDGVSLTGGCEIALLGCTLTNIGRDGVAIEGGVDHRIVSCDIAWTGECGVRINAGDRTTLTPCNHQVHNCHLHHIAREGWTYCGAVELRETCGAIVTHNVMHDHRHALMCFRGNDNIIAYNECYNYTLEGDDCGCMYTGRKFDYQGNIVRYNWIHHAGDSGRNAWGSSGVYMDDGAGGTEITGNIFHYVDKGILAGGGVNIAIRHNVFVNCSPAIWFDERCVSARADRGETMVHGWMRDQFFDVKADAATYQTKYPHLDVVLNALRQGTGVPPLGSCVAHNIALGSTGPWLATHWSDYPDYFEFHDNLLEVDPGFLDPTFGLFTPRADSEAAARIGFHPIPFDQIGLVKDAYRMTITDACAALEVVEPLDADGQPGIARLRVRNRGDVAVRGVELVELKLRRHGPGVAYVEVPFDVPAGEERAFDFSVSLPAECVRDRYEIFLCTRGEVLRPVWDRMPLSYALECRLELLAPPRADGAPGTVKLTVRNVSREAMDRPITLRAHPDDAAVFPESDTLACRLAPGEEISGTFPVALTRQLSHLALTTSGEDSKPADLRALVTYRLADTPALRLTGQPRIAAPADLGTVCMGIDGDCLTVDADILDHHPVLTEGLWDGSSIEVYGCDPDRERIGHVFGNFRLGQVYLAPAVGDTPAQGYYQQDNANHPAPDIVVASHPTPTGYRLQARIPLKYLGVGADADQLLFEIQANSGFTPELPQRRANAFGSSMAYQDSSCFALGVRG